MNLRRQKGAKRSHGPRRAAADLALGPAIGMEAGLRRAAVAKSTGGSLVAKTAAGTAVPAPAARAAATTTGAATAAVLLTVTAATAVPRTAPPAWALASTLLPPKQRQTLVNK
jgi:hypothetical protein